MVQAHVLDNTSSFATQAMEVNDFGCHGMYYLPMLKNQRYLLRVELWIVLRVSRGAMQDLQVKIQVVATKQIQSNQEESVPCFWVANVHIMSMYHT